jgi:(S)-mandelate dehydrogenase
MPTSGLGRAYSIAQLQRMAKARLPRLIYDFFEGGAEDELTLRANAQAFGAAPLVPRAFMNVETVDTGCDLLGSCATLPMAIAPMGAVAYGWRDGDLALARAAASAGIPYTLSTMAAASIEQVAEKAGGRLWFQAHLLSPRERTLALVERARAAGYEALMITADLPAGGKRERDLRNGLAMPFRMRPGHVLQFASRPRWAWDMLWHGAPSMPNMAAPPGAGDASSIGGGFDARFDWEALRALRRGWPRRLIVKGLLHPADARSAVDAGADAVVVSNHGGRQLDGCIPTFDALAGIVDAIGARAQVFIDGGISRGRDILKARLAGADGVLLGRAALWGVCAGGQAGAEHAIALLADELERSMRLCGVTRWQDGPPAAPA